jgi:predicted metal-dependent phosphoesterase TrpH
MLRADLHIHSTASDGSDSIPEIIAAAGKRGLDCIAVTDHDTTAHFSKIPPSPPVRVLCGVEISAADRMGRKAHILGYRLQKPELVEEVTRPVLEARNRNCERQIELLVGSGYQIDPGRLPRADGKYLYKQHILDYLVSTGQTEEMFGGFYQSTFKNGGICDFDIQYADVFDAVDAVRAAGGLSVLAHSGQQQNFDLIPDLVKHGLNGLELNHHTHSDEDRHLLRIYAARYELFLTGGSDYHGTYEQPIFEIGTYLSEESGVNAICGA